MRKFWLSMLIGVFIFSVGCSRGPAVDKQGPSTPNGVTNENHLVIEKTDMRFEVGQIKYFPQEMIPATEGQTVIGIGVAVTNLNKQKSLMVDPQDFTITTDQGKTYSYSAEKTKVTGKGAFLAGELTPDFRINGLILYEIPKTAKVKTIHFKDKAGHQLDIKMEDLPSGV